MYVLKKLVKTFINAYEVITDFHLSLDTVLPSPAPCYLCDDTGWELIVYMKALSE